MKQDNRTGEALEPAGSTGGAMSAGGWFDRCGGRFEECRLHSDGPRYTLKRVNGGMDAVVMAGSLWVRDRREMRLVKGAGQVCLGVQAERQEAQVCARENCGVRKFLHITVQKPKGVRVQEKGP